MRPTSHQGLEGGDDAHRHRRDDLLEVAHLAQQPEQAEGSKNSKLRTKTDTSDIGERGRRGPQPAAWREIPRAEHQRKGSLKHQFGKIRRPRSIAGRDFAWQVALRSSEPDPSHGRPRRPAGGPSPSPSPLEFRGVPPACIGGGRFLRGTPLGCDPSRAHSPSAREGAPWVALPCYHRRRNRRMIA